MRKAFISFCFICNKLKTFLKNKYKDLLAVFLCLVVVIISTLLIGNADLGARVQFTSDAIISLSGADTTLYALTGSEADSITVSGSTMTVEIPASSNFTISTANNKVLKISPSGNAGSLIFDTVYLSSGYVSQWTVSGSGTGVSFLVGVPEANADYLVKANGDKINYYKSTGAKEISFSYTGDLTSKVFQVVRQNQPSGGPSLPSSAYQAPATPKQGFSVSINSGAEKTASREVNLSMNGGTDAKKMSITESKDFINASQESYATSKTWTLSAGDGLKTVYVKFFSKYGQPTEAISDNIVLEIAAPEQQLQEETKTVNKEEPVITPPVTEKPTAKEKQPKTPAKIVIPGKTSSPAANTAPAPKITTVPAKEPIIPKTKVDNTPPTPVEIIEKVADDEITPSVEPKIVPEEKSVSPEKNDEPVKTEKSIIKSIWQGVVNFLKKLWPF